MTLSKKTIQGILKKRNLMQVSREAKVAYCSVHRLANAENVDDEVFQDKTINALSDYLSKEFNYILKNHIIELKGE